MHYAELDKAWAELTGPGAPFEITTVEVGGAPIRNYLAAPPSVRPFQRERQERQRA